MITNTRRRRRLSARVSEHRSEVIASSSTHLRECHCLRFYAKAGAGPESDYSAPHSFDITAVLEGEIKD